MCLSSSCGFYLSILFWGVTPIWRFICPSQPFHSCPSATNPSLHSPVCLPRPLGDAERSKVENLGVDELIVLFQAVQPGPPLIPTPPSPHQDRGSSLSSLWTAEIRIISRQEKVFFRTRGQTSTSKYFHRDRSFLQGVTF